MPEPEKRSVPVSALRFTVGEFTLGDNGDDAKTAPFRMVARSGQPVEHWFWGRIVHDLSGVRHKQRIPIDYAHDDKEVIGYANHFGVTEEGLEVSGALVPYKDSDRASEVVHKYKAGVPYEASINFGGNGVKLENVPEATTTKVNGYDFEGPGIVVRQWPLRGVAVCPYGADEHTSSEFSNAEQMEVTIMTEQEKPEVTDDVGNEAETVDGIPADDKAGEAAEVQTEAAVEPAEPEAELTESNQRADGLRFLEAFGDQGGVWFAQGLSWEEASAKFVESLKEENRQLKDKLAAKSAISGVEEPVSFSEAPNGPPKKTGIPIRLRA